MISGLAVAEVTTAPKFRPQGYLVTIGSARYVVITPLDKSHSVLIARQGSQDQYMVEGLISRAFAEGAKLIAGKPSKDPSVRRFVNEMVLARQATLGSEKAVVSNKIASR